MIKDFISIIVPVYNVKDYLSECVQSIVAQTYKYFELILIDDGSTDGSGMLCDQLALGDERIKVIHQSNGGVSAARNLGIQTMRGEYCCFIDSDDTIHENYLQTLYGSLVNNGVQLSVCAYQFVEDAGRINVADCRYSGIVDKDDAMLCFLKPHGYRGYLCNKLMVVKIILENRLLLDENLKMMEDLDFTARYMAHVDTVCLNNIPLYNYLMRSTSASHCLPTKNKIETFAKIVPFISSVFSRACQNEVRWTYWTTMLEYLQENISHFTQEQTNTILNQIRTERIYFFRNRKFSLLGFFHKIVLEIRLRQRKSYGKNQ